MHFRNRCIALQAAILAAVLAWPAAASAQDQRPGLFGNLFNRGEEAAPPQPVGRAPQVAQAENADVSTRLDRIENALRQLTGTIEELQHRNQQLEMRLQRMQDDTEYRFQQLGSKGGGAPAPRAAPQSAPVGAPLNVRPEQALRRVRSQRASQCAGGSARARR